MLKRFYDEGWYAQMAGEPFTTKATNDWKDGWRDCAELPKEKQENGAKALREWHAPQA